jgi:enamine deaminase RidA (YjgF/YER057c/UK114 family)
MVYISGCIGMQASTGKLVGGGVEAEAREVMKNLKAGLSLL